MSSTDNLIDLLRHGETEGAGKFVGRTDVALTAKGRRQMEDATAGDDWDVIVSSPLSRCADFARELAEEAEIPFQIDDALIEIDLGGWEGLSAEEIMAREPGVLESYWRNPAAYTPKDGESVDALMRRARGALDGLVEQHSGSRVLVVTHAGVIRALMASVLGMPGQSLMSIEVPTACFSRIRVPSGGRASLVFHDAGALC